MTGATPTPRARWFSWASLALVILGGGLGAGVRAAITLPASGGHPLIVPGVTLGINLLGSLLLGIVVARLETRHPRWRAFIGTGLLGGFTTYSALAVQTLQVSTASPLVGLALAAVSVIGGVLCAAVGIGIGSPRAHEGRGEQ